MKDLSGINKVAGEGIVSWKVLDKDGREVALEIKAYYIPSASVRLLSPQCVYQSIPGSNGFQDATTYTMVLPGDMILEAPYGHANLPIIPLSSGPSDTCFWNRCFNFRDTDNAAWNKSITHASNCNLTPAQKELLIWHQKLSHASLFHHPQPL